MSDSDYAKLLRSFKKVLKAMGEVRDELEAAMDLADDECDHCNEMVDKLTGICDDMDNALMDYPDYGF
jgi:molecular chaperone GrpE (heat shock protein)